MIEGATPPAVANCRDRLEQRAAGSDDVGARAERDPVEVDGPGGSAGVRSDPIRIHGGGLRVPVTGTVSGFGFIRQRCTRSIE